MPEPTDDGDENWEYALDDVGPEADPDPEPEPLEPGSPSLENAAFVALGVAITLLLLWTAI